MLQPAGCPCALPPASPGACSCIRSRAAPSAPASSRPPCGYRAYREVMVSAVGVRIGPGGRTQQREAQHIVLIVVADIRFVHQAEAMLAIAQIGPAMRRNFKLRLLPAIVARGGRSNAAIRNLVGAMSRWLRRRETRLSAERGSHASRCHSPHQLGPRQRQRVMSCTNFEFCQVRETRITARNGPFSISSTESTCFNRGHVIECARIDIPRVDILSAGL